MKTTIYNCDVCNFEIPQRTWEDDPKMLSITTDCSYQNTMARIVPNSYQLNIYQPQHVCESCMRQIAETLASKIESLLSNGKRKGAPL
jgi:ribosomal protein L37AE/L43A